QQANNGWLRFSAPVFKRSGISGHVGEAASLSQKASDFDIGIHSIVEFAIKLQEVLVFEQHRGVALFDRKKVRGENAGCGNSRIAGYSQQSTGPSLPDLARRNRTQK